MMNEFQNAVERLGLRTPVIETCELNHHYYKQGGSDTRCPYCLAVGLDEARRERDEAQNQIAYLYGRLWAFTSSGTDDIGWRTPVVSDAEEAAEYLVKVGQMERHSSMNWYRWKEKA